MPKKKDFFHEGVALTSVTGKAHKSILCENNLS